MKVYRCLDLHLRPHHIVFVSYL